MIKLQENYRGNRTDINMNALKKLFIVLAVMFTITAAPFYDVSAEETGELCGLLPIEEELLSPEETDELLHRESHRYSLYGEVESFPACDIYTSQLSPEELSLYSRILNEYERLYYSAEDIGEQRFAVLTYDGDAIDRQALRKVYFVFYYTNPRYFYAYNGYSVGTAEGSSVIALKVYKELMDGETRCAVREGIEKRAEEWLSEAAELGSDLDRELFLAQKICGSVSYVSSAKLNQSLAGAMYYGECVCNGYAMAVNYLCNLAGLDTFTVVSRDHAWNAVNLYGTYYMLDTTWMDSAAEPMQWANKSRAAFEEWDRSGSHIIDMSNFGGMTLPPSEWNDTDDRVMLDSGTFPDSTLRNGLAAMLDSDGSGGLCLNEYVLAEKTDLSARGIGDLSGIKTIPSIRYLDCSYDPVFFADIDGTALDSGSFVCHGSTVTVGAGEEISVPPSFDFQRASDWRGGYPDEASRRIIAESGRVSYKYDCGNGISESFVIRTVSRTDTSGSLAEDISFGFAEGDRGATEDIARRLSCGDSVYDIIKSYGGLTETDGRDFIYRLYFSLLGRFPDAEGAEHWRERLEMGCPLGYILKGFLYSDEFGKRLGSAASDIALCPSGSGMSRSYVTSLYRGFLRRDPSEEELALWDGASPKAAAAGVIGSAEYLSSPLPDDEFVFMLYAVLLERDPDPEGFVHWSGHLAADGAVGTADMFMMSEEFGRVRK